MFHCRAKDTFFNAARVNKRLESVPKDKVNFFLGLRLALFVVILGQTSSSIWRSPSSYVQS